MRTMFLCLAAVFFAGCVPAMYGPYYEPSYADDSAEPVLEACYGQAGPPSGLKFSIPDGIVVEVSTAKHYGSEREDYPFYVMLRIPSGVDAAFLSDEVQIMLLPEGTKLPSPDSIRVVSSVRADGNATFAFDAVCPVSAKTVKSAGNDAAFSLDFWIRDEQDMGFVPDQLELHLPALVVDENTMECRPIIMDARTTRSDVNYLTTAMQEHLQERYRRCLDETPERRCKNIINIYQEGFRETYGDFTLSGRMSAGIGSIPHPMGIGLKVDANTTEPWRFGSSEMVVKDTASGREIRRNIRTVYVRCDSFQVPVTTPVRVPSGMQDAASTLFIEGSLGMQLHSRIEIRLPPMRINGRIYEFKAIRLELNVFDGGIYPFNC